MATSIIRTLQPFQAASDDFEKWVEVFREILMANGVDEAKEADRCRAIFTSNLGLLTYTLFTDLLSPEKPKDKKLADLITVLQTHFPAPKALAERFRFRKKLQQQGETLTAYVAELRKLASSCKFTCCLEERLRDQLILGMSSVQCQKIIFTKEDDIKLDKVLSLVLAQELAAASTDAVRQFSSSTPETVHKTTAGSRGRQNVSKATWSRSGNQSRKKSQGGEYSGKHACSNCGFSHSQERECSAKDKECHNCGKKGHFSKCCRAKAKSEHPRSTHNHITSDVHATRTSKSRLIEINVDLNGITHNMEFDTGCQTSILSHEFWRNSLGSPPLSKSQHVFNSYTNTSFVPMGEVDLELRYKGQVLRHKFPVVKGDSLFGRDLLSVIKVDWPEIISQCNKVNNSASLTLSSIQKEFADVFGAPDGPIRNFTAKVILKDDAVPRLLKARPVSYTMRALVDQEL